MFRLRNWFRKLAHQCSLPAPRTRATPRKRFQPRLETLEPKILLTAAVMWTGAAGDNNWNTGGNWSTGTTPGSGENVIINVSSPTTIVHSATATDTINSLVSNAALLLSGGALNVNTTLSDSAGVTLQGGMLASATGTLSLTSGNLQGYGTIGSSVQIGASASLTLGQTAGDLAIKGGLVLDGTLQDNISGNQPGSATGYEQLDIGGNFENDGTINVLLNNGFVPGPFASFQIITFGSRTVPMQGSINAASLQSFFDGNSLWLLPSTYQTATVTTTADSGAGSLRAAITQANAASTFTLIAFNIPTSDSGYNASTGVWTIAPASALPVITNPVLLDATTQAGYAGKPVIDLSGTNAGAGVNGLILSAGQSTITGLVINNFQGDGMEVVGSGATGDTIAGNYIGTDARGTTAAANGYGVLIWGGASNNIIGGMSAADRNIISGNSNDGVEILGAGAAGNVIEGDYIGTDATGKAALANRGVRGGVYIFDGASNNIIGGTSAGARNVISGNTYYGVEILGTDYSGNVVGADGNVIEGNYIGTEVTGSVALANGSGVFLYVGANNNTIGGPGAGAGNLISGNTGLGVEINNSSGNIFEGNYVGTDVSGRTALGDGGGIWIDDKSSNNIIGGTSAADRNIISGNSNDGVEILGTGTAGNVIEGNYIGTNAAGTAALGNSQYGVSLNSASVNTVVNNTISGNGSDGINVNGNGALPGALAWYQADGNANDAVADNNGTLEGGATANGPDVTGGAGNSFNFNGSTSYVQAPNTPLWGYGTNDFSINLWVNFNAVPSSNIGNPSDVFVGEDNGGGSQNKWFFALGGGVLNFHINNTSDVTQFIDQVPFTPALHQWYNLAVTRSANTFTIYVNGVAVGSQTNATPIPTGITAPLTIGQAEGLGYVNGSMDEVAVYNRALSGQEIQNIYNLGGAGQGGAVIQGNYIGTNAAGTAALANGGNGITIANSSSNTLGGTTTAARNIISGNRGNGINITGSGSSGNVVEGDYLGTNAAGTAALANSGDGVSLVDASGNTIGGTAAGAGNVISGNSADGIQLSGSASNNLIQGNDIGTNAAGSAALGDGRDGVLVNGANVQNNLIGGTVAGAGNVISANGRYAIYVRFANNNTVQGNYIGTDATGNLALGSSGYGGIGIISGSNNLIGGTAAGAGNVISGNSNRAIILDDYNGVDSTTTSNNTIEDNLIGTNAAGTNAVGNAYDGIEVGYAQNTLIASNVISGSKALSFSGPGTDFPAGEDGAGIILYGPSPNTIIRGNKIGTDKSGNNVLANQGSGIFLRNTSATITGNQISGNAGDGITLEGNQTPDGLSGLWHAENNTSDDYGLEGTMLGGATYAPGISGQAFSFNGVDGAFQDTTDYAPPYGRIQYQSGGTMEGWIKTTASNGTLLTDGGGIATGAGMGLFVENGKLVARGSNGTAGQFNFVLTSPAIVNDGQWHHVAVTWTGTTAANGVTLYVDGVAVATGTAQAAITSGSTLLYFGGEPATTLPYYNGLLDEVGVYSHALSASDLATIYSLRGVAQSNIGSTIAGNFIGTNAAGTAALGNGGNGINILGTSFATVGGTTAADRNIISGNTGDGIRISGGGLPTAGAAAINNVIEGNYLGTNAAGTAALANGGNGVTINNSSGNTVGGTTTAARNVISGNSGDGVSITGSGTTGNVVEGNDIGTDYTGRVALANGDGVSVNGASGNIIGGAVTGVQNVVTENGLLSSVYGIAITSNGDLIVSDASNNQLVRVNPITGAQTVLVSGGSLVNPNGIARAANGDVYVAVSAFSSGTPEILSVDPTTGAQTVISSGGSFVHPTDLGIAANGDIYVADDYAFGGNGAIIKVDPTTGAQTVVTEGDGSSTPGEIAFDAKGELLAVYAPPAGGSGEVDRVDLTTGTRTPLSSAGLLSNPAGLSIAPDGSLLVTTIGTSGPGNIVRIDPTTGAQSVVYSGGALAAPVELAVADNGDVYATSYADATFNHPEVVYIASNAARNIISGNTNLGVVLSGGSNNQIAGNLIGLGADGTTALGNALGGIEIEASNNIIGGTTAAARNVISANGFDNIRINGGGGAASGNTVEGNFIGTTSAGTAAAGHSKVGIYIQSAADNTIGGSTNTPGTGAGNVISGNAIVNLNIVGAGSTGNVVEGNLIGTDATGTLSLGTTTNAGVQVATGAADNTIGGVTAASRNVISGNSGNGVVLAGSGTNANTVEGNFIGTSVTGVVAVANAGNGVLIENGSSGNTLGGTTAGAGNLISGNLGRGVWIFDSTSNNNRIEGNTIGADATGAVALGNGRGTVAASDIRIEGANNIVGGTAAGAGNVIAASGLAGVRLTGAGATGNLVEGNLIGTNAAGTAALGNLLAGVLLDTGANGNTIGGTTTAARNVISGNANYGLQITDAGTSGNTVEGDYIGTDITGVAALGNHRNGVFINNAANNILGGPASGQGNTIAFNTGAGVAVTGVASTGDAVRGNRIYSNTGLGIDLGDTGTILANDSQGHSGPNNFANYPIIQSVIAGPNTVVSGSLQNAGTPGTIYYLDFYANTTPNASGHGDAQTYLGSETVTTDSTGQALFSAGNLGPTSLGQYITVTATDQNGNTSEFALNAVPAVADTPPGVAITGSASMPAPGIPIALGSTISDSQTGKTYTYAWNVTRTADSSFTLPAGTVIDQPNLTFTPAASGTYVATLTVTDSLGGISTATPLTITVGSGGQTLGINGAPASAAVNSSVTLNALATEPPGVTVTSYAWSVTKDGAAYALPSGTTTNAATFTFTPAASGSYVVTLTATNSAGAANSTSVSFLASVPSVVIVGAPANAGVGTPIRVGANVNDPALSAPFSYNWSVTENGTTVASVPTDTSGSFTFTPAQAGTYAISLTVTDAKQSTIVAASTSIQVTAQAPTVTITGAPAGAAVGTALSLGSQVTEPVGLSTTAYAWSITRDGQPYTPAISSGAASPAFSFTPSAGGLYTVTLNVTDSAGTVGGGSVSILVSSEAVAITGTPASVGEGSPVALSATPVDSSLSGSLSYRWSVTSTNPAFTLPSATATTLPSFTFTPTEEGSYTVGLTATNAQNQVVSTTTATFAVTNTTPTATISGVPASATAGVPITLTGSAATPGSTDSFTFSWSVLNGNTGQTTTGTGPTFTFTPAGGPEMVTLTATDEAGASASTSVVITATQAAGGIHLSQAGSFQEGAPATMDAQLVTPPAGVTYGFLWTVTGQSLSYSASGTGVLGTTGSSAFTFTPPAPGTYLVSVTANGSDNSTSAASELVTVANSPPTVTITGLPTGGIVEGTAVNLLANVSDPGLPGDLMKYQWTVTGPNSFSLSGSAPTLNFSPIESGVYAVAVTVTDSSGAATTATANFTVNHVPPVPLIQNAPGSGLSGTTVTVNLTASVPDPGGDDAFNYVWTALDQTKNLTLAQGASQSFSFSAPLGDALLVSLTVSDDDGGSTTATVPIFVASAGSTLTLAPAAVPSSATQVFALALGNAKIDASALSIPFDAAALGSGDTLIGGNGPNVLQGDSGFNSLVGGSGPNTLFATAGDTLVGGAGVNPNLFAVLPGAGEVVRAGSTANTLSFAGSTAGITLNLNQLSQNGGLATQFAGYDGQAADILTLAGSFQNLVGSGGADNLFAASNSVVYGGGGNDTLTASGVSDATLAAGSGDAILSATNSNNVLLFAGAGSLGGGNATIVAGGGSTILLQGGGGNSTLPGSLGITQFGGGNDTLSANGGGNVTMIAGAGNATLSTTGGSSIYQFGGSGNDSIYSSGGSSIYMQGGTGNATLASSGGSSITQFGGSGNDSLYTSGGSSIYMQGGTGNATLSSSGGSSITQFGGTGNDSLYSSGGSSVYMQGGTGNATLSSSGGSSITQFGGSGNDSLYSSGGSSIYMQGGSGNATLVSSGGSSITQFGGSGNDSLYSSGGSSVFMQGGSGNATLSSSGGSSITQFGGSGNDSLYSSGGSSIYMQGGTGNSTLASSGGSSITQFGGSGNDSLYSSGGSSVLMVGGSGNVTLASSGGSSITQFGGSGNDSLYSSGGSSIYMQGGTGNSTLVSSGGSSITQFGGSGNDSLYSTGGSSIYMQGGTGNVTLSSSGGSSITQFGGSGNDSLYSSGGSSIYMQGGSGNATLASSGGSSITQFGGSGNDSLYSSGGSSIYMQGGSGNTTLSSSGGSSITQFGGSGNDSLYSSGGSSVLMVGGTGNVTLASSGGSSITQFGGSGNDSLYTSGGSSIYMQGGTGNSTLSSSGGSSITQFGGSGNDSLYSSGGSSIYMQGGTGNATLASSGGSSITQFGGSGNDSLYSSGGSSVYMQGGSGNSTLSSSGGSSITQFGGSGNDSLYSSGGSSIYMQGGTGDSTLVSSGGSSITQFGGSGNDSLYASGGSSVLMVGGTGNATLVSSGGSSITQFGGSGNDSLYSSGGSSIYMQGGTGNSTLSSSGGSSITQFGGSGNDSLSSSGGSSIYMQGGTGNSTLASSGGSSITQFGGSGNDSLYSSGGSSILMAGGSGTSTLVSSGGSSITQFGGSGNDSLYSSGGSSIYMQGGSGNVTLSSSGGSSITQFGGSGNDSLYSSGGSSIYMQGGSGNSTLVSSGGSSITQFGGSGNDSLYSSGGSSILMAGGSGNDSLYSSGGASIFMQGGSGNSTLASSGGSSITQFGGSGNDSLASSGDSSVLVVGGSGTDTLNSSGDANALLQAGGATNDFLSTTGGSSITLVGGSGNDTLSATGGAAIAMAGLDGDNTYELNGSPSNPLNASLNDLSTFGQTVAETDAATAGVNTILFPGVAGGIHLDLSNASQGTAPSAGQFQNVAPGLTVALTGPFQNVVGTPGNDWIHGNASSNVLSGGGSGNDTLIGGSGPATLLAGAGNDSLVGGSGGTTYRFAGSTFGADTVAPASSASNDTLDFAAFGGPVNLNLASAAAQTVNAAVGLQLTLANPLGVTGVLDTAATSTPYNDAITGNSRGDAFTVGTGNDTFNGAGGDSYFFTGTHLGSDNLNEAAGTQNALNFLAFGAPINLNLSQSVTAAPVSPGNLTLTLSNPSAFTTVVGTPYPDTIIGNNSNDTIVGAGGDDSLMGGSGSNYIQGNITQVVYLDFAAGQQPGDLVYTASERDAIQAALAQDYNGFNYVFTQDANQASQLAQMTGGQFATLYLGSSSMAGGAASQLDPGNLNLGGSATIDISSFLGSQADQVSPTLTNIINLTATIAAHELGHLSGLQHQDAFGPIGTGIYSGVNPDLFYPVYTGPANATQTPDDVMASPGSMGTTIQDAAGQTYLGERDLIKLAFNDTGAVLAQPNLSTVQAVTSASQVVGNDVVLPDAGTVYNLGSLPGLAVPNTLPVGVPGAGQTFAVTAAAVNASIQTGQVQYYAFQGSAGELMNFQVISSNNTLNPHPILPALEVLDAHGNLVSYAGNSAATAFYGTGAVNQHEFESNDSSLYDVTLPAAGTYYVGVTTLPISPSGNYQLFLYSFGTDPASAGDTLVAGGGTGADTMVGSSGNDNFGFLPGYTGYATVYSGSGQDTVNFTNIAVPNPIPHVTIVNQSRASTITLIQPTTTTVSSSSASNPPVYGSAVTLTATVTSPNGATPTGSVAFYNNGVLLGTATLNGGSASLTTAALPAGNNSITANYTSDSNLFTNSIAQPLIQVVKQAQPAFSGLTASQSISYGTSSLTLSGHLIANAGQQTIPQGETVTVTIDGVTQSTTLDGNDNFTIAFDSHALGASATPYAITYRYAGDTDYQAAADSSTTLTVNVVATVLSVPSATVTSDFGQALTFTATVTTKTASAVIPAGVLDFYDATTQTDLGVVALSSTGTAQLTTTALPAGVQTIALTYADPKANFVGSSASVAATIVPSIYVLNPTAIGALTLAGNSSITTPGLVLVDSNSTSALLAIGNTQVTASAIRVVGGYRAFGNAGFSSPPTPTATVPDPLAGLPIPSAAGLVVKGAVNLSDDSTLTIGPGIYTGIHVSGNARLTLQPGIYVMAGGGFAVTGDASVTGSGVLIYNAGSNYNGGSGNSFGGLTLSGKGTINLTAAPTGPYAGVVIFQSRDNARALALSGNAVASLGGGIVYAPAAPLIVLGNAQLGNANLPTSPLVVNELWLLGNGVNDLTAAGTANNSAASAGQLLAGDVTVYVDNSTNAFTADELARVQDAINVVDAATLPYGVTVTEVDASQSASATTVLTMSSASAAGSAADGILGCESNSGITLVSGWNWYTGSDPAAIGAGQYDFETILIHELGHALGLGHSPNSSSVMYAALDPGTAKRVLTASDLNIPDTENGPCALHAAVFGGDNSEQVLGEMDKTPLAGTASLPTAKATAGPLLAPDGVPSLEEAPPAPFTNGMGWVAKWAWLALGLGGNLDPAPTTADFVPDTGSGEGYKPSRPGVNPSTAGVNGNRNGIRFAANSSPSGDAMSPGDNANALEDSDRPETFAASPDLAVLDQFFQQFEGSGAEGEAGDMAGDF